MNPSFSFNEFSLDNNTYDENKIKNMHFLAGVSSIRIYESNKFNKKIVLIGDIHQGHEKLTCVENFDDINIVYLTDYFKYLFKNSNKIFDIYTEIRYDHDTEMMESHYGKPAMLFKQIYGIFKDCIKNILDLSKCEYKNNVRFHNTDIRFNDNIILETFFKTKYFNNLYLLCLESARYYDILRDFVIQFSDEEFNILFSENFDSSFSYTAKIFNPNIEYLQQFQEFIKNYKSCYLIDIKESQKKLDEINKIITELKSQYLTETQLDNQKKILLQINEKIKEEYQLNKSIQLMPHFKNLCKKLNNRPLIFEKIKYLFNEKINTTKYDNILKNDFSNLIKELIFKNNYKIKLSFNYLDDNVKNALNKYVDDRIKKEFEKYFDKFYDLLNEINGKELVFDANIKNNIFEIINKYYYIIYIFSFDINVFLFDIYNIIRIFKKFDIKKHPQNLIKQESAENIFVIVGDKHRENFEDFIANYLNFDKKYSDDSLVLKDWQRENIDGNDIGFENNWFKYKCVQINKNIRDFLLFK